MDQSRHVLDHPARQSDSRAPELAHLLKKTTTLHGESQGLCWKTLCKAMSA